MVYYVLIQSMIDISSDTHQQGPFDILATSKFIPIPNCFAERESFHWCFFSRLVGHCSCNMANTAIRRQNVCFWSISGPKREDAANNTSAFYQTVCIIGYTLFPLVITALLSAFHLPTIPRIPVYIVLLAWSLAAGVSILGGSGVVRNRVGLAVYPLFVFYVGLGCLCFIS